jgi:hypothetical protein
VIINCRATNLNASTIYLNSAIAKGDIGSANGNSLVAVSDSSNNGDVSVVDPNKNGNAGDVGENIPTPYVFTTLPVKFVAVTASFINKKTVQIKWDVATPLLNAASFIIEFSADAIRWQGIGSQAVENTNSGQYHFTHFNIPYGKLFYRIKQTDNDGSFVYSNIVLLNNSSASNGFIVYPNPASGIIQIAGSATAFGENATAILFDATGRLLLETKINQTNTNINVGHLPNGTYHLKMLSANYSSIEKIVIKH